MSVKKQPAFVCDITEEASMNEADFYAVKIPDERKFRHIHREKTAEMSFADVMAKLAELHNAKANGNTESASEEAKPEAVGAGAKNK